MCKYATYTYLCFNYLEEGSPCFRSSAGKYINWYRENLCHVPIFDLHRESDYGRCYKVFEVELQRFRGLCYECFEATGYIDDNYDYEPRTMSDGSPFYIFQGYNLHGPKDGAISRPWGDSMEFLREDNAGDQSWKVILPYQNGMEVPSGEYWKLRNFWQPSMRGLRYVDHGFVYHNHPWYSD
jgi:hypothetical protein